ncbi:MAG: hypothetical protein AB7G11_14010 [Phycisphaerales bacterium]
MTSLSPRPRRREIQPGDVVRLSRRFIDAVLRAGSDDRAVVRRVHPRAVYVESLARPGSAWYVRRALVVAA